MLEQIAISMIVASLAILGVCLLMFIVEMLKKP